MDLYETKYNAALERAEMLIEKLESTHIKGFIYHIFPELIKSNEEQIKKRLIKAFRSMVKEQWGGIAVEDILAWLEKQGKQEMENSKILTVMTLDEAIEHCKEKSCDDTLCGKEHRQLAEWLTELKGYRVSVTQEMQKTTDKNEKIRKQLM